MTDASKYRPDIDGLRAIAVLGVLLFHAELSFPGGFVGVDVFFVISGFLITRIIVNGLDRGTFTFRDFWTRRLRRIIPAATAMTLMTLLAGAALLGPTRYHQLATDAIAQALMLANVQFARATDYFGTSADLRPLLHTWSLAVEEQFYLFHPFIVALVWRWRRDALLPVFITCTALSFLLSVVMLNEYPSATFYLLPTRAWELLLGGCISLAPIPKVKPQYGRTIIAFAGLLLIALPMFLYDRSTPFPALAALPPCLGTAILIISGSWGSNPISRAISIEPLRRIGLISYSLYLAHWPILAFMRSYTHPEHLPLSWRLFAIALSFLLAYLSWRFVEQAFRHRGNSPQFAQVLTTSVAASAAVVCLSFIVRETDGLRARFSTQLLAHIEPDHVSNRWTTRISADTTYPELLVPIGTDSQSTINFLLWGDSHAAAISQLVHEVASNFQINGIARIANGTSPVPQLWSSWIDHEEAQINQQVLDTILERQIHHVILCARWSVLVDGDKTGPTANRKTSLVSPVNASLTNSFDDAKNAFQDKLSMLIAELEAHGVTVWVLTEVPFQKSTPQQRGLKSWITGKPLPKRGVSRQDHNLHTMNATSAIRSSISDNTRLINLAEPFFDATELSIISSDDGASYYFDDDHINMLGADEILKPLFQRIFADIASKEPR